MNTAKRHTWLRIIKSSDDDEAKRVFSIMMKDNIDPVKWCGNWLSIYSLPPLETDKRTPRIEAILYKSFKSIESIFVGKIHSPTKSCPRDFLDLPMGFPKWFVAAYPEVVNCLADLALWAHKSGHAELINKRIYRIIRGKATQLFTSPELQLQEMKEDLPENWEQEIMDQDGKFNIDSLIRLKDAYKRAHPGIRFECS